MKKKNLEFKKEIPNPEELVSPTAPHSPDLCFPTSDISNQVKPIVRVIPKIILGQKKISLPKTKCFMIPDFLGKNISTRKHCSKCVNRFNDLGNDFIRMTKNNLVSELPFPDNIQKIALQCTKCKSENNLVLVNKNTISNLRKMCREEEPKYLKCPDCNKTFSSTEKITEAFDAASLLYNQPKIDLTRSGKKIFLFNGIETNEYAKLLETFAQNDDFINYQKCANEYNFEIAKAMAHTNIHHWSHFESCFKYSKSKAKKDRKCRYRKPDWPSMFEYFVSFEIDKYSSVEKMEFNRTQRAPYIFFSESNTNLLKSLVCNHCVKLVLSANLAFYWAGYSTKCNKDTSNCVSKVLNNMLSSVEENEKFRLENNPRQKSYYQLGLSHFSKASNNFEINSTVGTSMGAFCIIEGNRFKYSTKFVPIIPYQSLQYITKQSVTAVVDKKMNIKLSVTHYIFRHPSLEHVNQYDFVQSYVVNTKSKLPKGKSNEIFKTMIENDGIYDYGRYMMLQKNSRNYLTHYIMHRSKKVTPNIFWSRPKDMRRLKFPSNQMYGRIYRSERILGDPYPGDKLAKEREQFAQNILILFHPFRNLKSFRISENFTWWDSLIDLRDLGKFTPKSIFHIENIQSWNDTFLSKSDGTFLGEETDSSSSDTEEETDINLASGMIDGKNLFDEEDMQEPLVIIKKTDFLNPKTVDHKLLNRLNESGQTFLQKNLQQFPELNSLNTKESYEYIGSNTPDKDNDEEKKNHESHFLSNLNEDDTLVYLLNSKDAQRGIHNYVPPELNNNIRDYDQSQPSINEMATVHGLSKKQFSAFSILCQKQLLNIYRTNESILTDEQKKTKKILETFFKKKPLHALLIGPAGTGKTRVLNCFFHWMVLWGLEDRLSVNSTTGVSANLLGLFLEANTWYHGLGLSLNKKMTNLSQNV